MSTTDVTSQGATATAPPPKPGEVRLEVVQSSQLLPSGSSNVAKVT